jgi:hypothetical protein
MIFDKRGAGAGAQHANGASGLLLTFGALETATDNVLANVLACLRSKVAGANGASVSAFRAGEHQEALQRSFRTVRLLDRTILLAMQPFVTRHKRQSL